MDRDLVQTVEWVISNKEPRNSGIWFPSHGSAQEGLGQADRVLMKPSHLTQMQGEKQRKMEHIRD